MIACLLMRSFLPLRSVAANRMFARCRGISRPGIELKHHRKLGRGPRQPMSQPGAEHQVPGLELEVKGRSSHFGVTRFGDAQTFHPFRYGQIPD